MEFLNFCFESGWHYFGVLLGGYIFLSLINSIVKNIADALMPKYTPINYIFPNLTKLGNNLEEELLKQLTNVEVKKNEEDEH